MKFKGTKGKWLVGNANMADNGQNELVVYPNNDDKANGGKSVIACVAPIVVASQEDYANARLMSKAPEMLEALQEFCRRVERGEVKSKHTYVKFQELIKSATEVPNE
ncbi:hypothetical protein ACFSQ3_14610 [Sphingobacterium corticis]|uniref:Uncharacterized protein n=1 Tax=Sphingobacterium corticis TaxID=1812823 RepID=A0ABW5NQS6_9SPHI